MVARSEGDQLIKDTTGAVFRYEAYIVLQNGWMGVGHV